MLRAASESIALRDALEDLRRRYDRRFIDSDPVGIVRRFDDPEDREIVGLIAAWLAYGRVAAIRGSLESLLSLICPRPSRFFASFDPYPFSSRFDQVVNRFTRCLNITSLLPLV